MGNLIFLLKLFKKDKLKNLVIIIQIGISVLASSFFMLPIIKSIETNNLLNNMKLDTSISFLEESIHIQLSPKQYTNENYSRLTNYIRNIEGVESIGSTYSLLPINETYKLIMYDKEICNKLNLPLEKGKWFNISKDEDDVFPIIISKKLEDKYPINSIIDINVDDGSKSNGGMQLKCKVIGILKNKSYIYIGGSNHSDPSISDLFIKLEKNDEMIIIPNLFDEMPTYWAYEGMLVKCTDFYKVQSTISENGIGNLHTISSLKANESSNILIYNEQKIYEFIIVFIFILISISGYNTLANLEYRKLLTIYYINGLTWIKGIVLLTVRNFLLIIVPTIFFSILSNITVCRIKPIYTFDLKNSLIISSLYLLVFVITTLITILNLKKQNPIEILKEED